MATIIAKLNPLDSVWNPLDPNNWIGKVVPGPDDIARFYTYTTNATYGTQTYDATAYVAQTTTQGSTNFVLHPSQETELIISILSYTGFIIKDPNMVQQAVSLGQGAQMAKQQQ